MTHKSHPSLLRACGQIKLPWSSCPTGAHHARAGSRDSLQAVLQACARNIYKFDLGFLGSARGFAAFEDVLLSRSRGLHHLVVGAVALLQEAFAEPHRAVIDDAGFLEGEEILVAAVGRDEAINRALL